MSLCLGSGFCLLSHRVEQLWSAIVFPVLSVLALSTWSVPAQSSSHFPLWNILCYFVFKTQVPKQVAYLEISLLLYFQYFAIKR